MRRILAFILLFTVVVQSVFLSCSVSAAGVEKAVSSTAEQIVNNTSNLTYLEYYSSHKAAEKYYGFKAAELKQMGSGAQKTTIDSTDGVVLEGKLGSWAEYSFIAPEDALYGITVNYYALESESAKDIILSISLDGTFPYEKAETFSLPRMWKDKQDKEGNTVITDKVGNDLRPLQQEVPMWIKSSLIDQQGLYEEPYLLKLTKGEHTLKITGVDETVVISSIELGNSPEAISYDDYISKFSESDYVRGEAVIKQAEDAFLKNDSMLYPTYDRTTANVTPYSPSGIKINTIGKENWAYNGQSISWQVPVKKEGLYQIYFHTNQDFSQSLSSYRKLLVNGELPFKEADNITFKYASSWYMKAFGEEKPLYVYLKPGDTVSLECVPGRLATIRRDIQQIVLKLNSIYREIISITSTEPDIYQDYNLDEKIPTIEKDLIKNKQKLEKTYEKMKKVLGTSGGNASTIKQVAQMLGELAEDPYTIPERLSNFKGEIENLGSLILSLQTQPLELDFIAFVPKGEEIPSGKASFFEGLKYNALKFLYSFITDYSISDISKENNKTVKVWVSTGRDQLQILSNMVNDSFTAKNKTNIKLSLIDTGATMLQASLAGKGPDVALMVAKDLPVNLAMREALADLSDYDFSTLKSQTGESAWTSFYYNGGLYALPESENFDMLFYRTDIFEELGLDGPPDTWEDFYQYMEIIQKNNFSVGIMEIDPVNYGISAGINTFSMFLYQNGGKYYNDKLNATTFESEVAYKSFDQWVKLYSKYGLERSFSFYNVFRSGEMPMGIANYSTYAQLMSAAPEIAGLWEFAPIPGTVKSDGTIDRSQTTNVTASIVLKVAQKHGVLDEAVKFVEWWTSEEIQTRYGKELEATMGVAARYTPANRVSLQNLAWNKDELESLNEAAKWTVNMEQIPGNYVVMRQLTSAARAAIDGKQTVRRALILYNYDINEEIKRKRAEFGLE